MFSSNSKGSKEGDGLVNNQDPGSVNLINKSTTIKGEVFTEGNIRIDGRLDGNLHCQAKVVVGESGVINGDIYCGKADFSGRLNGDLYADELLHLKEKGVITGNIHIKQLIIEASAVLNGNCEMGEKLAEKQIKAPNRENEVTQEKSKGQAEGAKTK